jgi:hypothetical protein
MWTAPIVAYIERAAGIVRDDGLREKLDKLDLLLQETSTSKQDSALLAEVLSLPNDGRYPAFESPRNSAGKERWKRSSRK